MERAGELKNRKLVNKSFLIILKYIPHLISLVYIIYTILGLCGIDTNVVGCFFHISLISWLYLLLTSIIFRFCYVHRLPLYYIGLNELITCIDYYIEIPIKEFNLIVIHSLLLISLIFGYSYFYINHKMQYVR